MCKNDSPVMKETDIMSGQINVGYLDLERDRFPFCIVWTPIPILTWIFPIIGHMGIAMSSGIIRDFAGPYFVSEDNMAFGRPTKYWKLNPNFARGGEQASCENNTIPVEELTDTRPTFIWRATDAKSILVTAQYGYQIQVDCTQLDVDGRSDDYVTVKSISEDDEEGDALMFTYTVSKRPSYLYNCNKVRADYVGSNDSNSFLIQFTRVGEPATTTPEPATTTTTELMPTASPEESATLTIYLYKIAASDFRKNQYQPLRKAIADMGTEYCDVHNCPLNKSITLGNVKIKNLEQCPFSWEDYENCFVLTFALPIIKLENKDNNSLWTGYQLNESNLKIMWDTYAEKYLKDIKLKIYAVPNINRMFNNALIAICLTLVILVILMMVLRHSMNKISRKRRKSSDALAIINEERTSTLSLSPHYLQELPPLFPTYPEQRNHENFSDYNRALEDEIDLPTPTAQPLPNKIKLMNDAADETNEVHA